MHHENGESTNCPPIDNDEFIVRGLNANAEILIDTWGVPHIYAESTLDAYIVQGFQAARDRLFQIDLWRRRGLGQLSEVFGSDYLEQDRASRLFLYRGDLRTEFLSYSTDARDIVTAFVTGINAYIAWCLDAPEERLPPEFLLKDYRPALWEVEDLVRIRTHGLLFNAEQELKRALTIRDLGKSAEQLRSVQEPVTEGTPVFHELYEHLDDKVLDVYRLAFSPVQFADTDEQVSTLSGSNNWVVGPSRTATGRPILANDPHRAMTIPSLRYLSHINAPGLSIIGAGEPHLPGISIGHNGNVAFGLTIWAADHEDLYVYELHPEDDDRYQYDGAWERIQSTQEQTSIAGSDEHEVLELQFTRHGPLVYVDLENRIAVAVRAVWMQPGMCPYLASLDYQKATDTQQFRTALQRWGAPGVNMIYASPDGDIGWQASALIPRRPGWDGSLPVPGDGEFEWEGFAEVHELPSVHNPEEGWFTNSNENNIPVDHDSENLTVTTDWFSNARHRILAEWLSRDEHVSVESSLMQQMNVENIAALELLKALCSIELTRHQDEWKELLNWDGAESIDSRPALIFQVWERRYFLPWLVDAALTKAGFDNDQIAQARKRFLHPDALFSDLRPELKMLGQFDLADSDDYSLIASGVDETLGAALTEIIARLGNDRGTWKWGELHQTRLAHPLFGAIKDAPREWAELPSIPRPGSGDTVGLMGYDNSYNALSGSSFRMAIDVGDWDASQVLNTPGQSGDPRSPHYFDLLDKWGGNQTFPMLYTKNAVEQSTVKRIQLIAKDGQ